MSEKVSPANAELLQLVIKGNAAAATSVFRIKSLRVAIVLFIDVVLACVFVDN